MIIFKYIVVSDNIFKYIVINDNLWKFEIDLLDTKLTKGDFDFEFTILQEVKGESRGTTTIIMDLI
jgi:hypothetical protein